MMTNYFLYETRVYMRVFITISSIHSWLYVQRYLLFIIQKLTPYVLSTEPNTIFVEYHICLKMLSFGSCNHLWRMTSYKDIL